MSLLDRLREREAAMHRPGLHVWCDVIEQEPVNGYRTFKAGKRHAALLIPVPLWLADTLGDFWFWLRTRRVGQA